MLQTAHGSLTVGLDARRGQTLLIRGGTSSVGLAAAILAKSRGLTVISTTRRPERVGSLQAIGVDHAVVDRGEIAEEVRQLAPGGVDVALELVGTPTLPDTLRATQVHGVVCFTGMLSNEWIVATSIRSATCPGGAAHRLLGRRNRPACRGTPVVSRRRRRRPPGRPDPPHLHPRRISTAHADMEAGNATGKLVVLP